MTLAVKGNRVEWEYTLPFDNGVILFRAEDLRKERTGVHGRFTIFCNNTMLAYSTFNIERDEDRVRLVNTAHRMLGTDADSIVKKSDLKHQADLFTSKAWPSYMGIHAPERSIDDSMIMELPQFIAAPHILKEGGAILFGPPAKGKSYTAIILAVCVDAGVNGYWDTTPSPTLFVNLERPDKTIKRRIALVNNALGLEPDRPLWHYTARGHSFADTRDTIREYVDEKGIEFVVLDSISRAGMGDLKEAKPANTIADALNKDAPTWLALAHTPRGDDTHIYGAVHFDAAADVMIRQTAHEGNDEMAIALEITKANDIKKPPTMYLAYNFDEYGLKNIRKAKTDEFPELEIQQQRSLAQEIKDYLLGVGNDTPANIGSELGHPRQSVARVLKGSPLFYLVEQKGRTLYYGVKDGT